MIKVPWKGLSAPDKSRLGRQLVSQKNISKQWGLPTNLFFSDTELLLVPIAVKLVQIHWFTAVQKAIVYAALPNQCNPVHSDEKQPHKDKSRDDTSFVKCMWEWNFFFLAVSFYPLHFLIRHNFLQHQMLQWCHCIISKYKMAIACTVPGSKQVKLKHVVLTFVHIKWILKNEESEEESPR